MPTGCHYLTHTAIALTNGLGVTDWSGYIGKQSEWIIY